MPHGRASDDLSPGAGEPPARPLTAAFGEGRRLRVAVHCDPGTVFDLLGGWLERRTQPAATLCAARGEDFTRLCLALRPDLIVLEVEPPVWRATVVLARLRAERAPPDAVAIALHRGLSSTALRMLREAGFDELVDGSQGSAALVEAMDRLLPSIRARAGEAAAQATAAAHEETQPRPAVRLTARELEVLRLIGRGLRSGDIAVRLGISARTVENHKRNLFAKLNVHGEAHAVALAVRSGLLPPGNAAGPGLTPREHEILRLAAAGLSVKQTAHVLGVAVKTVESLQRQLFRKLGVRGRAGALAVAGVCEPLGPAAQRPATVSTHHSEQASKAQAT